MSDDDDKKPTTDDDVLEEAREEFERAANMEEDNRREALDDLKFARLGEQWPAAMKRQRELESRPALTINKLPAFIRQVVNDARQNKPAIKVHPVDDSGDPATAEIMNDLIRNIEYTSSADVAYDTATECAVSNGWGYIRISTDYAHDDSFDLDIKIDRVANPFSIYGDPDSQAADSSDWNVAFVIEDMPKDAFCAKYKNAEEVDWEETGYTKIKNVSWFDDEHVKVCEYWTREEVQKTVILLSDGSIVDEETLEKNAEIYNLMGVTVVKDRVTKSYKVMQRILTGAEVLSTTEWPGRFIPIVPVYGDEVNVEGKRYFRSLVRDAKDPQRMFNYWRTTATELVALAPKAPYIGRKGTFDSDLARWSNAHTTSYPFLEYDNEMPQRQAFAGVPAGVLQEALNSSDDMKAVMGIYDASLGARSNETSGVGIAARQRQSDVSNYHFQDNMARAIRHAGRILLDLIPKVYTQERVVRLIGEDGSQRAVKVNGPTQVPGPDGNPIEKIFDLTKGRYDLTVSTGPSYNTKRQESADQMTQLIQSFPQAAPVIGDLLVKSLDWPNADEIAERLAAINPLNQQQQEAAPPAPSPDMQIKAQIAQGDQALEAKKVEISAYQAETERLKAMATAMTPENVQQIVVKTISDALRTNIA